MLDKRTTIALSVIASLLLAFILVFERGTLSTSDVARRSGHVLTRFIRDEVSRVELVRGDEPPIVFEREPLPEDAEEGQIADFRIAAPLEAGADQDAVSSFLGALEWLMGTRTLEGLTDADRARYGLTDPRFVVRFRVAGEEVALRVGGDAPEGQGVYVGVEGADRAYVVGADFVESIDHDLSHFRDKALFPDDFYPSDAVSIRLEGEAAATVFEREGDAWLVREPVRGWANAGAVDGLKRLAREARIERFVAEDAGDLGRYGLDRPWRELTITRPDDANGTKLGRLRVGDVCGEHAEERYAIASDDGPVVCVLASALDALSLDEGELREQRLLPLAADAIERVVLEGEGARVELAREDAAWELIDGAEATPADEGAVSEWLAALRDSRAQGFEAIDGEPGHGLDAPRATLTVTRSDADEELVIRLGDADAEGAWVRRGEEPALARFEASAGELLRATPLRFRDRALVPEEAASARSIAITRGGTEERAVRGEGGTWTLEAPIEAEADRVVVRAIARQIAELRAERFIAERAAPEHGLSAPRQTVTVGFEGEGDEARAVTLRVGAATEGGAFAQLEGEGAVFVVGQAALDALDASLVSLDVVTLDTASAQSLRIERGGEVVADLAREGDAWQTAEGAPADGERTRALLDRLSTLRAAGVVRYGAPSAPLEAIRVTVTGPTGPVSLEIGEERGEGEDAYVPARRSDVGVVYRLRPDLVGVLRTYVP